MKYKVIRINDENYRKLEVLLNILVSWVQVPLNGINLGVPGPGTHLDILRSRVLGPGIPPADVQGPESHFSGMPIKIVGNNTY